VHLRNPEPNLLEHVAWVLFWPVLGIDSSLTGEEIDLGRVADVSTLEHLPDKVAEEENWDTDVRGDERLNIPCSLGEHLPSLEDDAQRKEDETSPSAVWLEVRPEDKSVAVNSLYLERLLELDVGNANADPGEHVGCGNQVGEPLEDVGTTTRDGHVGQPGDGGSDCDAVVWDTTLVALQQESWSLTLLSHCEEITRSSVQEGVGGG